MKHFFYKFLCMHPRLVLCFFFAMSGTPLVASQSFESSAYRQLLITELCLYNRDSIVFHQGEDNNFDILDDCEKELLLAGYARKNFNDERLPSFFKEKLDLAIMPYIGEIKIGKIKKEPKIYVQKSYNEGNHVTVNIPKNEWFATLKPVELDGVQTELLLCGFLSRENRVYIPNKIIETLVLYLHDERILDKKKEVEDILKNQIEIVRHDIANKIKYEKELRRIKKKQISLTCDIFYLFLTILGITACIREISREGGDVLFGSYFLSVFCLTDIYVLGWIIRPAYC